MSDSPSILVFISPHAVLRNLAAQHLALFGTVNVFETITAAQDYLTEAHLILVDSESLTHPMFGTKPVLVLGAIPPSFDLTVFPTVQSLPKPVQLRTLASCIQSLLDQIQTMEKLGPYIFKPLEKQFLDSRTNQTIRLTDSEVSILAFLLAADAPTPRDVLLQQVLKYNPAADTHTLEMHIYRLRQKLEDDPKDPKLLVTTESGYLLIL